MDTIKEYINFNELDFAGDEMFQDFVLRPSEKNKKFWNDFILEHPSKQEAIDKAIRLVQSIQFNEDLPDEEQVERSLNRSLAIINKEENTIHRVIPFKRWMAAASVLIILSAGILYFYFNNSQSHSVTGNMTKNNSQRHDFPPGGNKAVLTLADGSSIILDSAKNGMLTQQGNAKVIKLQNGKVAYEKGESGLVAKVEFNTVTTPRGGQYQLELADGSRVWLNAASSITFPTSFNGNKREVKITGEAYFEVAHNANMPFSVKVNDMEVKVLGTHFNVNAYADETMMKTTLLEGSVKVSKGNESALITPGEQAQIAGKADKIEIKRNVDLEEIVAWKDGKFLFQDADIHGIMRQLERWYNITVSYEGNITNEEFVGVISRDVNISQILNMLEKTGAVKFEIVGRKIIVK